VKATVLGIEDFLCSWQKFGRVSNKEL